MAIQRNRTTGRLEHVRPGDPCGHWTKLPGSIDTSGFLTTTTPLVEQSWVGAETSTVAAGATVFTVNSNGPVGNGTVTKVNDATGFYINYLSSTTISAVAGWNLSAVQNLIVTPIILPDVTYILKTGAGASDVANVRIWATMQAASGAIASDLLSVVSGGVGFRYSTPGSDTTWHACSSNGATDSSADTGVAVAANTRYVLRLKWTSASSVDFYVNGTLTNSFSSGGGQSMPASGTLLIPSLQAVNAAAGTGRNLRIRMVRVFST